MGMIAISGIEHLPSSISKYRKVYNGEFGDAYLVGPSIATFSPCIAGSSGCVGANGSNGTTTSGAITTFTSATPSTTTTSQKVSSTVSSTVSTTHTSRSSQCVDLVLPVAWSGGGAHTCLTYHQLGLAYCNHAELQVACCFCGGGRPEPTTSSTLGSTLSMTTTITATAQSPCSDAPLPVAWSGGGTHTCSTYEQHGGSAYCSHRALAEACCFCRASAGFSALSVHAEAKQASAYISKASIKFTANLVAFGALFLSVTCRL